MIHASISPEVHVITGYGQGLASLCLKNYDDKRQESSRALVADADTCANRKYVFSLDPTMVTKYLISHRIGKLEKYLMPSRTSKHLKEGTSGVSMCFIVASYWTGEVEDDKACGISGNDLHIKFKVLLKEI